MSGAVGARCRACSDLLRASSGVPSEEQRRRSLTGSPECPSSDSFNVDIQAFVQHQQQEKRPLLAESEETNELVSQWICLKSTNLYQSAAPWQRLVMYSMQFTSTFQTFLFKIFIWNTKLEQVVWERLIEIKSNVVFSDDPRHSSPEDSSA